MNLPPFEIVRSELVPSLSLNDLYQFQFVNRHYLSILRDLTEAKAIRQRMRQLKLNSDLYDQVRPTLKQINIPHILHRIDFVETHRCLNIVPYSSGSGVCLSKIRSGKKYCFDCSMIPIFNPNHIFDTVIPYEDYNLEIDDPDDPNFFCYDVEVGSPEISFVKYRGEMYDIRETPMITDHNRVGKLWKWSNFSYIIRAPF